MYVDMCSCENHVQEHYSPYTFYLFEPLGGFLCNTIVFVYSVKSVDILFKTLLKFALMVFP